MKKSLLAAALSAIAISNAHPQGIMRINDPHIRAQQERMVFRNWGNFMPYPKYKKIWFLEIQTNWWEYERTWGMFAFLDFIGSGAKYRGYRDGPDIRPLGPKGEQTQRVALTSAMLGQSGKLKKHAEGLGKTALSEAANHTGLLLPAADPLWLLYYKRMLRDVKDYRLATFTGRLGHGQKRYLEEMGTIDWLDDEMGRLSERLNAAFGAIMNRGARILNYHRILLEYEKILGQWQGHVAWAETRQNLRHLGRENRSGGDLNTAVWNTVDERALMAKVMEDAKKR